MESTSAPDRIGFVCRSDVFKTAAPKQKYLMFGGDATLHAGRALMEFYFSAQVVDDKLFKQAASEAFPRRWDDRRLFALPRTAEPRGRSNVTAPGSSGAGQDER